MRMMQLFDLEMPNLKPAVQDLKTLIETDPEVYMLFNQMFEQIPHRSPYNHSPDGKPQVRNYGMMLRLFNHIMTKAPEFNQTEVIGAPIAAIICWPMGTVSGYAAFLNDKVNKHFKTILNCWGLYLKSEASCYVLTTDPKTGWLGADAMSHMPNFKELYKCDPLKLYWGFKSWDNFFTREFRDGVRPIASPDDDAIVCNACESAPYRIEHNVKRRSRFWIKSQNYPILFMLANDPLADQFVGGTVYQAILTVLDYHRWHSPVNGKIIKSYNVPGTYYSETRSAGYDPSGSNKSQGYLTEMATRTLVFIEADNPDIGLMCFMAVGNVEVSSCEITVADGQRVRKGQEIGMFHYGGSTYCLIFRSGVKVDFELYGIKPGLNSKSIHINAKIATVSR